MRLSVTMTLTVVIFFCESPLTTVEPPIKEPQRRRHSLSRSSYCPKISISHNTNTFRAPRRGQPLNCVINYSGQNGWSQCVLYSEVPLYVAC